MPGVHSAQQPTFCGRDPAGCQRPRRCSSCRGATTRDTQGLRWRAQSLSTEYWGPRACTRPGPGSGPRVT
jgi:hypothetical protein